MVFILLLDCVMRGWKESKAEKEAEARKPKPPPPLPPVPNPPPVKKAPFFSRLRSFWHEQEKERPRPSPHKIRRRNLE